jgi:hypothetical protein
MSTENTSLTEQDLRDILAASEVYPSSIEDAGDHWIVWYGMGHPVCDEDDARRIAALLDEYPEAR